MLHRITGRDQDTGEPIKPIILPSMNKEAAIKQARQRGILVETVQVLIGDSANECAITPQVSRYPSLKYARGIFKFLGFATPLYGLYRVFTDLDHFNLGIILFVILIHLFWSVIFFALAATITILLDLDKRSRVVMKPPNPSTEKSGS